jgi:hypothetical protein
MQIVYYSVAGLAKGPNMKRLKAVIFSHILASYIASVLSIAALIYDLGIQSAPGVIANSRNLWYVFAPLTTPVSLVILSQFYLRGKLRTWQVMFDVAQYVIPFALLYLYFRAKRTGDRRGFSPIIAKEHRIHTVANKSDEVT